MAWYMAGHLFEACSCKMLCPCFMGPAEPDQEWCSGTFSFRIQEGASDGVDLSGCKVVWRIDLPGDFVGGNGTARLYVDEAATADQRRKLEAIFTGKQGGPWAVVSTLITTWLPTQIVQITIEDVDNPAIRIGNVGQVTLQRIRDEAGRSTRVLNAPALGAFQLDSVDLAYSNGTQLFDPAMRRWQAGGSGSTGVFRWSA